MTRLRFAVVSALVAATIVLGSSWVTGGASGSAASRTPRTGVVVVNTTLGFAGGTAAGTGIVLTSSGEVLTNNHVVRGATSIQVTTTAGRSYSGRVLGYSVSNDIALIQLSNAHGLLNASFGNSDRVNVGQAVTAVGNAGGTGSLSIVTGRVTDLARDITVNDGQGGTTRLIGLIATSAPLEPGDSGGPLLLGGRVIGVDAAGSLGFRPTSGSDGFAIPIDTAMSIARQIESGKRSSTVHIGPTAFLGVGLADGNGDTGIAGVFVRQVVPGAPADRAGISAGDVLTAIGARKVASRVAVQSAILQTVPGRALRVTWVGQDGRTRSAIVRPVAGPPQ